MKKHLDATEKNISKILIDNFVYRESVPLWFQNGKLVFLIILLDSITDLVF